MGAFLNASIVQDFTIFLQLNILVHTYYESLLSDSSKKVVGNSSAFSGTTCIFKDNICSQLLLQIKRTLNFSHYGDA